MAVGTGVLLIAFGLFAFLLYLYFFVDFNKVVETVQQVSLAYYLLAFVALILSVAFYSLTWQRFLNLLSLKASFLKAFQYIWVGSFVDLLVPAESISGDISRIYLMSKELGENAGRIVASVVSHRILAMSVTFGGLLVSSIYFVLRYKPQSLVVEFIAITIVGSTISLGLLFYLSMRRSATEKMVNWLIRLLARLSRGRWRFERLKESAETMLKTFYEGIITLGERPRRLALPIVFAIIAWFFDLLIVVLVFYSLGSIGLHISLSAIVIVYSIGVAIQSVPVGIPGEVGLMEIVMTSLYTLLGVPIAISAVATVLVRVLTLWVKLLIGGVTVQWLGIKGLRTTVSASTSKSS